MSSCARNYIACKPKFLRKSLLTLNVKQCRNGSLSTEMMASVGIIQRCVSPREISTGDNVHPVTPLLVEPYFIFDIFMLVKYVCASFVYVYVCGHVSMRDRERVYMCVCLINRITKWGWGYQEGSKTLVWDFYFILSALQIEVCEQEKGLIWFTFFSHSGCGMQRRLYMVKRKSETIRTVSQWSSREKKTAWTTETWVDLRLSLETNEQKLLMN